MVGFCMSSADGLLCLACNKFRFVTVRLRPGKCRTKFGLHAMEEVRAYPEGSHILPESPYEYRNRRAAIHQQERGKCTQCSLCWDSKE